MKTYEFDSTSPDGWKVTAALKLEDDGHFSYSEGWTDYTNASLSGGASGTWRRDPDFIVFRVEWKEGPMYFQWEVGQERRARELDDALAFEYGWKLRLPRERIEKVPARNPGEEPLTLVLEPWGVRHTLAPGESAHVVSQGRWSEGEPYIDRRDGELVFDGRNGSWATVVPDPVPDPPPPPQPSKPPERPRASNAEAAGPSPEPPVTSSKPPVTPTAKPNVAPTVKPPSKPPAPSHAKAPAAPFVPRAPSPELAALLRRWVEELTTDAAPGNYINRLCKENDAIPLDGTEIYLWALRTDGQVLCIDHESFAQRAEPEEDAETAYSMLAAGAERHPELRELLPPERRGGRADG